MNEAPVEGMTSAAGRPSPELLASFALLDALVSDAPVGLGFWDTDLRYLRLNAWLAEMAGVPAQAHVGEGLPQMLGALGERLEERAREVLRSGEPVADVQLSGETPPSPNLERHWRVSFYPVDAPDHTPLGVGATIVDVTSEQRAVEREQRVAADEHREHVKVETARADVLARVGAALSSSLEPESVLDALVRGAVPELADWCAIHTAEAGGEMRLRAIAHSDPESQQRAWEMTQRFPPNSTASVGAAAVIRTGRPEFHPAIAEDWLAALSDGPEHLESLRALGLRSSVILPLRARRRILGALTLTMAESGRHYTAETLKLAESVAAQAGIALENARLYSEQAAIATSLQRSLLPPELPEIPGVELAACYRPAGRATEVGGDFYDVFSYEADCWRFLIGDVVGKGADAAALTGLVRYMLHGAAVGDVPLDAKLGAVNDALLRHSPGVDFCSLVYGVLSMVGDDAHITLVCCGHPPPLILRADGRLEDVPASAPLLGVELAPSFEQRDLRLAPGDTLLLYTDGVIELPGRDPWRGDTLLRETVRAAAGTTSTQMVKRIERATLQASGGKPRDDVAVLAIQVPRPAGGDPVRAAA